MFHMEKYGKGANILLKYFNNVKLLSRYSCPEYPPSIPRRNKGMKGETQTLETKLCDV